jgi:hypothetical protein
LSRPADRGLLEVLARLLPAKDLNRVNWGAVCRRTGRRPSERGMALFANRDLIKRGLQIIAIDHGKHEGRGKRRSVPDRQSCLHPVKRGLAD